MSDIIRASFTSLVVLVLILLITGQISITLNEGHKTHCLYVKEYKIVQDNGDVLIRKCEVKK